VIEAQSEKNLLDRFIDDIKTNQPTLSRIDKLKIKKIEPNGDKSFIIKKSTSSNISTMLSADIAMCDGCRDELYDKTDRRYLYPFINCIECGPRYSIIKNLPYDRERTSIDIFEMCDECRAEYEDITNRRYHAQPISCHRCGMELSYIKDGIVFKDSTQKVIDKITKDIKNGDIVAIKGLGGFHIVCDALAEDSISNLRVKKNRISKPFAVMFKDIEHIKEFCEITSNEQKTILSKEKPIVIVNKKVDSKLPKNIAPNIEKIGVFLPYTPLHEIILNSLKTPIIATSANLSGEPIIKNEADIFKKLSNVVYSVLTYNRDIVNSCDDSVVCYSGDELLLLRSSRGYAPKSFYLDTDLKKVILALGANQKSTISLAFKNSIISSPYIGDLDGLESVEYFSSTIDMFKKLYNLKIDTIVCDKHPEYESTKWAKEYIKKDKNITLIELQHHYSHTLSCIAEYRLDSDVLAFCFDGTGYGDDGSLWGGEVLIASTKNYERVYSFSDISLLGGSKAIKQPKRVALSLLFEYLPLDEVLKTDIAKMFTQSEIKTLHTIYKKGINSPRSSSVGRLFDAIYAFVGFSLDINYDGESGLLLEKLAKDSDVDYGYSYNIKDSKIDIKPMIMEILQQKDRAKIAKMFIITLAEIVKDITLKHPNLPVILTGGVFQNTTLVFEVTKRLKDIDRRYYIQHETPLNDSGISLGQAYYAIKNIQG